MKNLKIVLLGLGILMSTLTFAETEKIPSWVVFRPLGGHCLAFTTGGGYLGVVDATYCNPFVKGPIYKYDAGGHCQEYNSIGGWIKTVDDQSLCCHS